jgi:hypothetical protein
MGGIFGSSGKKEAKAITESSQLEAAAAREAARGAVMTQQTMLAQDRASKVASELLSRPQGEAEVDLESVANANGDTFDPATGKRRTKRQSYSAATSIQI